MPEHKKDRFEELIYSALTSFTPDQWSRNIIRIKRAELDEMLTIYRALKQENLQLVETIKTLRDSKISVSKAPSRWIDEIVDSLKEEGE